MNDSSWHALRVLEYERIREIVGAYATTALGKERARNLSPLRSVEEIRRRLTETEEMRALLLRSRLPLAGIHDVAGELDQATSQGRPLEPDLLYSVVELSRAALSVRETLTQNPSALPTLSEIGKALNDLPALREAILARIDPRGGVRDDATEKLAVLRRDSESLRSSLRSRATRILSDSKLRTAFQSEGLTFKNDRYLLPVKAEYRSLVHGPIRDRSQSGSTFYVEPEALTQEGDRLLDVLDSERAEVTRILWELTRQVLESKVHLEATQDRLGLVDFIAARAAYAEAFDLVAPEVNEQGVLELKDARHPYLLWLARDLKRDLRDVDVAAARARVVPMDVRLGETFQILVVTGPNTGGKTVVLKTAGLSVLMALSGLPISAAPGSRVPCYTNVFADIGDEQSIEQSLSTFSSHLKQVMEVLAQADERSLILLDELGAGTDPLEGAALGRALLDKFLSKGWNALITTHIGSLKELAYSRDGVENAAMEFDPRTLQPTYRLLLGIPGSSNAILIARRIGLDREILEAAEREMTQVNEPTREILGRMEQSRRRVEKERRRAERTRRRVQGEAKVYEERFREIEALEDSLEAEAQQVVDDSVREAKDRLTPLVEQLKNVPKTHRAVVDTLAAEIERLLVSTPLGAKREEFARSLKKEDEVYIPKFRDRAKVKKIDKGGRRLTVLLNGISTEISFDDVTWISPSPSGPRE